MLHIGLGLDQQLAQHAPRAGAGQGGHGDGDDEGGVLVRPVGLQPGDGPLQDGEVDPLDVGAVQAQQLGVGHGVMALRRHHLARHAMADLGGALEMDHRLVAGGDVQLAPVRGGEGRPFGAQGLGRPLVTRLPFLLGRGRLDDADVQPLPVQDGGGELGDLVDDHVRDQRLAEEIVQRLAHAPEGDQLSGQPRLVGLGHQKVGIRQLEHDAGVADLAADGALQVLVHQLAAHGPLLAKPFGDGAEGDATDLALVAEGQVLQPFQHGGRVHAGQGDQGGTTGSLAVGSGNLAHGPAPRIDITPTAANPPGYLSRRQVNDPLYACVRITDSGLFFVGNAAT